MTGEKPETCIACKITTVSALAAIGGYLIHQGIRNKIKTYLVLGTATICLGIKEIFNKDSERKHEHTKQE